MSASDNGSRTWTMFLDFDGVLNNEPFLRHQRNHPRPEGQLLFDPENISDAARNLEARHPLVRLDLANVRWSHLNLPRKRGLGETSQIAIEENILANLPHR